MKLSDLGKSLDPTEHGAPIQEIHSMAHHTVHGRATKRMVLKNLGKDLRGVFKHKCEYF